MKKFLALLLALVMVFALAACGEEPAPEGDDGVTKENIKVGFIFLHDENSTYDLNFINAANAAIEELGLTEDQYEFRTNVPENEECYNAAADLADDGCNIIFADSFGHEDYIIQAAQEFPDVVFVATGADRFIPPIPGIDRENIHHVLDVDTGRVKVGDTVVVCGGGLSGMESALELSNEGKKVTVVDMIPVEEFAKDHSPAPRGMLLQLLEKNGVKLIGSSRVTAFTDEGVVIENQKGERSVLPCTDVVAAFGMKKNDKLLNELRQLIPDVIAVGDCNEVKNIKNANQIAFNMALEI